MQIFIVVIILAIGVVYIGLRIYKTFKNNSHCTGCPLIKSCTKGKNNCKPQTKQDNSDKILLS